MTIPTPITTPSVLVYLSLNVLIEAKKKLQKKLHWVREKERPRMSMYNEGENTKKN